jgi:hypothetical protein
MFIVMITTISWGMLILLASLPPETAAETNLPPSDSKERLCTRAAVSANLFVCSPSGRYFHSPFPKSISDMNTSGFNHAVINLFV